MDTFADRYLKNRLKNWAGGKQAPEGLRRQLLERAARPTPAVVHLLAWLDPAIGLRLSYSDSLAYSYRPTDWSHMLYSYNIVHSFQNGLSSSRLII